MRAPTWRRPSARHARAQRSWWCRIPSTTGCLKLIGTRGRFESDQKHRGVELATQERCEVVNPYFSQLLPTERGARLEGYGPRSIEQFVRDVEAREAGRPLESCAASFEEGVISSAVCEAVRRSLARRGRWTDVELGDAACDAAAGAARSAAHDTPRPGQAPLLARP